MKDKNDKITGRIDSLIYFFSILFLASLTNSIFINQIGYYFALFAIVYRYYLTRVQPFKRTGLEYAFLFYMAAEILSTVFSVNPGQSFHNLLKRFFLIPIVYTFIISSSDFERAKKLFLIYLGAAMLTMIVYLGFSYNYYVNNLYQLYESGPSNFQYPITSSELMSFSLVFLFTFLINEKMTYKFRTGVFLLFLINLLALLATYKRTGWMGAALGMLFVIMLGRKWILLIPIVLLLIAGAFIEKNISKFSVYDYKQSGIAKESEYVTDGRAYNVCAEGNNLYVSDFENGLVRYTGGKITAKYNYGAPAVDFKCWKDSFYVANLIDTRFILLKKKSDESLEKIGEFLTPGFTVDWHIVNGFLYVLDSDSGLTIYRDPRNGADKVRVSSKAVSECEKFFADESALVLFSKTKEVRVFSLKNNLPDSLIVRFQSANPGDLIYYNKGKFIASDKNGVKLLKLTEGKLEAADSNKTLVNAVSAVENQGKLFVNNTRGDLYEIEIPVSDRIKIKSTFKFGFVPKSIAFQDDKLIVSQVKRSRMLSIVDPYIPSNFSRLALWRAGLLIFKDHPLFGVGDIDLAKLYKQYKRPYDKEIQGHLHNNYFHLLTTLGGFGFIAAMFLLISVFVLFVRNFLSLKSISFAGSYALGACGSYLSFLISGLTEWNFGDHEIITMVWFMLALSIAFSRTVKDGRTV